MVDVLVHGGGWIARALVRALRDGGADARLATTMSVLEDPLGIALPVHPEHPHRFIAALGRDRARALIDWARPAWLHPPTGVIWTCPGDEARERAPALLALGALGLRGDAVSRPATGPEAPPIEGYLLPDGGLLPTDTAELPRAAADTPCEIEVLASGAANGWLADKVTPVRWHAARFTDLDAPPTCSRHASVFARGDTLFGARWAEPHFGIGDTGPEVVPVVVAMLGRLARQDHGVDPAPRAAWSGIAVESCDGLPILGPLPGRPRVVALAGFGIAGATWGPAAIAAVTAGILGLPGAEVPPPLRASRLG